MYLNGCILRREATVVPYLCTNRTIASTYISSIHLLSYPCTKCCVSASLYLMHTYPLPTYLSYILQDRLPRWNPIAVHAQLSESIRGFPRDGAAPGDCWYQQTLWPFLCWSFEEVRRKEGSKGTRNPSSPKSHCASKNPPRGRFPGTWTDHKGGGICLWQQTRIH